MLPRLILLICIKVIASIVKFCDFDGQFALTASGYGFIIPDAPGAESHILTKKLGDKVGNYVEQYIEAMEKVFTVPALFVFP